MSQSSDEARTGPINLPTQRIPAAVPAPTGRRWDVLNGLAAALLLLALLLPWNLYFGVGIPGSNALLRVVLFAVTVLSLIPVALGRRIPHASSGPARLLLNVPYLLLVLAFVGFDAVQTLRYGGTAHVPGGVGPGAWLGTAGALLSARPTLTDAATDDEKEGGWLGSARIIGNASIVAATLSFAVNLYWRVRYALHGPGGADQFGKQNIEVTATAVVYGVVALLAILVASRWLLRSTRGSRLAAVALGASALAAGIIVWSLPVGRDVDAFHGIAQNTSTAGVGFEGYLAWAAAAAIFLPATLSTLADRRSAADGSPWREAARKCLVLIAVWCLGSMAMRITDLVVAWSLNFPNSPYDSMVLAVFDVATAAVAIWLSLKLGDGVVSPRLLTWLCGLVAALAIARVVLGIALAPRFQNMPDAAAQNPVYGNNLAQQITSTFDVLLSLLALCVLGAAIAGQLLRRRRRRQQRRADRQRAVPPPSAAATTAIPTARSPRIFRGPEVQDSVTRQLPVHGPKIYRSPH